MKKTPILLLLIAISAFAQTTFMVPMRDSVHLATDIFLPPDTAFESVPILLTRTPYGRGDGGEGDLDDSLLAHGIGFAIQDSRGRGGSEGVDSLFLGNGWGVHQDGYDAVEWLAAQPWCNGDIAMIGGSGDGIMTYLAVGAAPPSLVCALVANCTVDMYHIGAFPGGCYRKEQIDNYFNIFGPSYMIDAFAEHYIYDSTWFEADLSRRYSVVDVPVFHVAGWFDTFCEGNIAAFQGFEGAGAPGAADSQYLVIGPWCHGKWNRTDQGDLNFPANSIWDFDTAAYKFLLHYLKDEYPEVETWSPVRCYVMGDVADTSQPGNEWVDFDRWPPFEMTLDSIYLQPDKTLAWNPPTIADSGLTYNSNPGAPVLHNGGRNLFVSPGPKNQLLQDLAAQGFVWTSLPLDSAITIVGPISARLFVSSDCIDTDFMVRVCDVYPSGTSYLILDGALKTRFREGYDHEVFMTPGTIYELEIEIGNVAICLSEGHRLRIGITSTLSSRYEPNPNTGEPFREHTHTAIASNTVYCDSAHPSRIILPLLPNYATEIAETAPRPNDFSISAYPNPFNSTCRIGIESGEWRVESVDVFDMTGRMVEKETLRPSATSLDKGGNGHAPLNKGGRGGSYIWQPGPALGSGVYLIRVTIGEQSTAKRVVYLK